MRKQIELVTALASAKLPLVVKMTTLAIEENMGHLALNEGISKSHVVI